MKRVRKQTPPADYLLARDAAVRFSLSRDYVTRLAREGKIEGARVGNAWHVSEAALRSFCDKQDGVRSERHSKLADARREEYGKHGTPAQQPTSEPEVSVPTISEPGPDAAPIPEPLRPAVVTSMQEAVHRHLAAKDRVVKHVQTTPLYAIHPVLDLVHRAGALVAAIAVVVGAAMFLAPQSFHTALGVVQNVAMGAAAAISSAHQ